MTQEAQAAYWAWIIAEFEVAMDGRHRRCHAERADGARRL